MRLIEWEIIKPASRSKSRQPKPAPHLHDTQQWRSAERGMQGTIGQVYLPTEIQKMLKDSGIVRIQILGG